MSDLVYANGTEIEFVDFSGGGPKPNLLTQVDNGIGKRTTIEYGSSISFMTSARETGVHWEEKLPFPQSVVTTLTTELGPEWDLNEDGERDAYRSSIVYRDGVYDAFEKEFRGFRYADKIEWGDDYDWQNQRFIDGARVGTVKSVSLISRFEFHMGVPDGEDNDDYPEGHAGQTATDERSEVGGNEEEALKGKVLWEESVDGAALALDMLTPGAQAPNNYVYNRTENEWRIRRLYRPTDDNTAPDPSFSSRTLNDRAVSYPFMIRSLVTEPEANGYLQSVGLGHPVRSPTQLLSEMEYDNFGNNTLQKNWGLVQNDGVNLQDREYKNDERFTYNEFLVSSENNYTDKNEAESIWLIDRVIEQRVEDELGNFVSKSITYYDGPDFQGLPLGRIGELTEFSDGRVRGLPTRVEQFINGPAVPSNNELRPDVSQPDGVSIGDSRVAPNSTLPATRSAYDIHGNVVAMLDPLGDPGDVSFSDAGSGRRLASSSNTGHLRSILYDDMFFSFPLQENIHLENDKPTLSMAATYDTALAVMESSSDFNANITEYEYDAYGRLTAIIKPGHPNDSSSSPTQLFRYTAVNPWLGVRLDYDRAGVVTESSIFPGNFANTVHTFARENFNPLSYSTVDCVNFTDGLGRSLSSVCEGELAADRFDNTDTGHAVSAAPRYNLRAAEFSQQIPYYRPNTVDINKLLYTEPPAASEDRTEIFPDALGRPVKTMMPPETPGGPRRFTITHHLPRETHSYDEEQTLVGGQHEGAHMEHMKDGLDRLIEVREVVRINDDGTTNIELNTWVTQYTYDLQDNLVHIKDSQQNEKWMRHDGIGRKVFMNDPDRGVMTHTYDDASNLINTIDAKLQEIVYGYDGANRLLFEEYNDSGESFSFERTFNPQLPITQNNRADVHYYYDAWPAPVDLGDGPAPRAPQNLSGMLARVEDLTGFEAFSYDERGRTTWRVKGVADPELDPTTTDWWNSIAPYSFQFTYDAMDRVRDIIYPDNDAIHYIYNNRGEIESIRGGTTGSPTGRVIVEHYDAIASGQEQFRLLGNDILSERRYDPRLRMNQLVHRGDRQRIDDSGTGYHFTNYTYAFDGASNILSINDGRPTDPAIPGGVLPDSSRRNTQFFQYDDLYRLTQVQYPREDGVGSPIIGGQIDYRYDRIGNMLSKTTPMPGQSGHFDLRKKNKSITNIGTMTNGGAPGTSGRLGRLAGEAPGPHALTLTDNGTTTRTFTYDDNGNMSRIEDDDATWDFKDRLFALDNTERRADYRYDYSDRRITKRVRAKQAGIIDSNKPSTTTLYIDRLFEMRDGQNPTKYVFLGDDRVARVSGGLDPARDRIQRFRFYPGWNLATAAVTPAGGATAQSVFGYDGISPAIAAVWRWDATMATYTAMNPGDPLTYGEAYWVEATEAHTRIVRGAYVDLESAPAPVPLSDDPAYLGWPRLEPLPFEELVADLQLAMGFNAAEQCHTLLHAPTVPSWLLDPANVVQPGQGFYMKSSGSAQLVTASDKARQEAIIYPLPNHLGSHEVLTNSTGQIVSETYNLPYGSERVSYTASASLTTPFGFQFTQKERDTESGLQYFEARYQHSVLGQFISTDPLSVEEKDEGLNSPQLHSPYSYCRRRPIICTDVSGKIDDLGQLDPEISQDSQWLNPSDKSQDACGSNNPKNDSSWVPDYIGSDDLRIVDMEASCWDHDACYGDSNVERGTSHRVQCDIELGASIMRENPTTLGVAVGAIYTGVLIFAGGEAYNEATKQMDNPKIEQETNIRSELQDVRN
jgi:RHS repeat-associated protein